ncbi:50S ribosomal protein L25 [Patescibacteria group bacterium]
MTTTKISLSVNPRKITGRKVKTLRKEGILPANIYGNKVKSQHIQVLQKNFLDSFKEAGETNIIELKVEGEKEKRPVLVSNVQVHPVSGDPIHVDFHQVDLKQKVTATVPVELVGESPAVKELGAVLFTPVSEVEVEALPTDIPDKLEIDISKLINIGETLTVKDLSVDSSKITISLGEEEPLAITQEKKAKEEVEEPQETEETEETEGDSLEEKSESEETDKKEEKPEEKSKEKKD